jgi:thiol-disulfide isomerase/thioredoxin
MEINSEVYRTDPHLPHSSVCRSLSAVLGWAILAGLSAGMLLGARPPLPNARARVAPATPRSQQGAVDALTAGPTRKPAPNFTLTDAEGRTIELSAFKGRVILLDFWATWCGGCKVEIPWYKEFYTKYKGQGLVVIGVAMDTGGWKTVRPFLALKRDPETGGNTAPNYPVVIGSESLAKRFNLTSMPMTLLIDRKGRVAISHTGMVDKSAWERDIRSLLGQS